MKLLIASTFAVATIAAAAIATPAAAQRVIIGPGGVGVGVGGVGVGVGARPYGGGYYGERGYRRGPAFEGRSAYREPYRGGGRRF